MPKVGFRHSAETKAKMSATRRGKKRGPQSPEHRAKIAESLRGRKHSLETLARISIAVKAGLTGKPHPRGMLGKHHTLETCEKMSAARKGKAKSQEWKRKIGLGNKGKIRTEEFKKFLSEIAQGKKHPRWLGGISRLPYSWNFNNELKEEVRRRDGYKCQLCGVPQSECISALCVHHIDYCKTNSDPVNLISLCVSCHMRTNVNREYWTSYLQEQMKQKTIN